MKEKKRNKETKQETRTRRQGRYIGCCVRKEGNKTKGEKRPVYIQVSSLRNNVRMTHNLTLSWSMSQSWKLIETDRMI